jgi:predicted ATPase/class 3 adenylate cyclase
MTSRKEERAVEPGHETSYGGPLPSGTLTYFLTDVEASTEMWEHEPDAMRDALARHDELIVAGVENHRGTVVRPRGEGDSRFAVFPRATDAVTAACSIQVGLQTEPWRTSRPLRVRMALHTGEADVRDGDYYGSAVNRCARLRALAHGGQILLSATTARLAQEGMTGKSGLRDLGLHHLKDLRQPEQVFQLTHPSLPAEFPALRSLESLPNNLPLQLTSFIGRENEMVQVKRCLETARLVTLTGSGGAGKTRLALQVAADAMDSYPDGTWLVELASVTDGSLVPRAVASVLQVTETRGNSLVTSILTCLSGKRVLLLLDNCEHLIQPCAELVETMLRASPTLRVMATSRESLAIAGEISWLVPSLTLPDPEAMQASGADAKALAVRGEAVRLFVDRAVAAQPSFTLTDRNAAAVAQICRRLDGIPLAIELAAARVKALSVEQIAARLDDRFRFLTGGSRTALPRQQTLQALIDWSHSLLTDLERLLLRRLSVFLGGWTLAAAESICAGDGLETSQILDLLSQLLNKSLVAVENLDGESRYRLLETIRQYARGKLFDSGETPRVADRHLDYFLRFAEGAEPHLSGSGQLEWLDRLQTEHDNLRAAIEWSGPDAADKMTRLRLAGALWRFWYVRGFISEGRRHLQQALAENAVAPAAMRAKALTGAALLAHAQGDYERGPVLIEESLALSRQSGDRKQLMEALGVASILAEYREDYERARRMQEEGLAVARELHDKAGTARALVRLGNLGLADPDGQRQARALIEEGRALYSELDHKSGIAMSLRLLALANSIGGDNDRASALLQESVALSRELGDKGGTAFCTLGLAFIALERDDSDTAEKLSAEGFSLYREVGNKWGIAGSQGFLGYLAARNADFARAAALAKDSLHIYRELKEKTGSHYCLLILAMVAEAEGRAERAVLLMAAADDLRLQRIPPVWSLRPFKLDYERYESRLRERLGAEAYERAWALGRSWTLAQAIDYALEDTAPPSA